MHALALGTASSVHTRLLGNQTGERVARGFHEMVRTADFRRPIRRAVLLTQSCVRCAIREARVIHIMQEVYFTEHDVMRRQRERAPSDVGVVLARAK